MPLTDRPRIAFAGLMAVRPGRWQYRLPDLWSLLLVGYNSRARLGEESYVIRPGMIMFMEPGVPKDYRHVEHGAHHAVHSGPRCPMRIHRACHWLSIPVSSAARSGTGSSG